MKTDDIIRKLEEELEQWEKEKELLFKTGSAFMTVPEELLLSHLREQGLKKVAVNKGKLMLKFPNGAKAEKELTNGLYVYVSSLLGETRVQVGGIIVRLSVLQELQSLLSQSVKAKKEWRYVRRETKEEIEKFLEEQVRALLKKT